MPRLPGFKHSEVTKQKIRETKIGIKNPGWGKYNELNPNWKGNKAVYSAYHWWLKNKFGSANQCDNINCIYPRLIDDGRVLAEKPKRFEWALIKGKQHEHKRENYIMLCPSCHRKYDLNLIEP